MAFDAPHYWHEYTECKQTEQVVTLLGWAVCCVLCARYQVLTHTNALFLAVHVQLSILLALHCLWANNACACWGKMEMLS